MSEFDLDIDQIVEDEESGVASLRTSEGHRFTALKMNVNNNIDVLRGVFADHTIISFKVSEQVFDALLSDGQSMKYTLQSFVNEEGFFEAISNDVYCRVPSSYTILRNTVYGYTKKLLGFGRLVSMTPEERKQIQQKERASQQVYEASLLREFRHKMIRLITAKKITTEEAQRLTAEFRSRLTSLMPTAEEKRATSPRGSRYPPVPVVSPEPVVTPPPKEYRQKSHLERMRNSDVSTMTPISSLKGHL